MADLFDIVVARKLSGGGGGGTTVEALSVTQNGTYTAPSGKAYSPVTVNVSGGSSDFSTAKLTVNGTTYGRISAPVISPSPTGHSLFPMLTGQGEHDIVIYTGGTVLTYDGDGTFSVSGNIQDVGGNSYLVTGDCTITISAPLEGV